MSARPLEGAAVLDAPAAARPFVRVTEVWTPGGDGRLRLASGVYGGLDAFEAVSGGESFARGEGLPGRAWDLGRPAVLRGFRGSYFRRTEAAHAAGLAAGVALPVFAGEALRGVVVFLFGDEEGGVGAVEAWRAGEDTGGALAQADGYYGAADHFAWISRHTRFPRGQGLPGGVWASGRALILRDLGASHRFVRSEGAEAAGLTAGLGLPVPSPDRDAHVLTLLSARGTPLARRFEVWNAEDGALRLADGLAEDGTTIRDGRAVPVGLGLLGEVARSGVPVAARLDAAPEDAAEAGAARAGLSSVAALPIHRGGAVVQVAAWYL